jgi:hypothetical protein
MEYQQLHCDTLHCVGKEGKRCVIIAFSRYDIQIGNAPIHKISPHNRQTGDTYVPGFTKLGSQTKISNNGSCIHFTINLN